MHGRLGSATLSQLAFQAESNQNFWRKKSQWDNKAVKKGGKGKIYLLDAEKEKRKKMKMNKCVRVHAETSPLMYLFIFIFVFCTSQVFFFFFLHGAVSWDSQQLKCSMTEFSPALKKTKQNTTTNVFKVNKHTASISKTILNATIPGRLCLSKIHWRSDGFFLRLHITHSYQG